MEDIRQMAWNSTLTDTIGIEQEVSSIDESRYTWTVEDAEDKYW